MALSPAEPVTPVAVRPVGRIVFTQSWQDLAFLHWEARPEQVASLLPPGTEPDLFDGRTYVGLIAFRMRHASVFGLPPVPYFGDFPETNVRLYSVDAQGRRGVVFRSLEASRLLPVLTARLSVRIPYVWARMDVRHAGNAGQMRPGSAEITGVTGDTVEYRSRRRWPGPRGAYARIGIRVGAPIEEPSGFEHFLTARWGLHTRRGGRLLYLPIEHPRWPLRRAELLHLEQNLIGVGGLPDPAGPPVSVLYSRGVTARFGPPR